MRLGLLSKDYKCVPRLTSDWKKRLLKREQFNLWAFIFGPFFCLYWGLGGFALLSLIISAFGVALSVYLGGGGGRYSLLLSV